MDTSPQTTLKLTDEITRQTTLDRLTTYLPLQAADYECSTETLADVLIQMATKHQTIETVCHNLADMVDGETVRGYLNEQIRVDDLAGLEGKVNQALGVGLPRRLFKTKLHIAFDIHDEPFYGHSPELVAHTCRGEAKKGTTRFFRLATAYVIFKDMRFTLALLFVRPEDETSESVAALLRRLAILGVNIARLYLDKGFCSVPVIRYLDKRAIPAIIACPKRGKKGGAAALCQGRASYQSQHTFKSQAHGSYTAPVTLAHTFTTPKRSKGKGRRARWLVFVLLNCAIAPNNVRKCYRKRFGIETSYRCMRQVRAWTTSRNAALRFLLMDLAFILVNLWIELRYRFCQIKRRRGPRHIDIKRFELQRMTSFLNYAIEQIYGLVLSIEADVAPLGA
jgi:putative transposase